MRNSGKRRTGESSEEPPRRSNRKRRTSEPAAAEAEAAEAEDPPQIPDPEEISAAEAAEDSSQPSESGDRGVTEVKERRSGESRKRKSEEDEAARFVGEPVAKVDAKANWPERYSKVTEDGEDMKKKPYELAKRHYRKALVDGVEYDLYDDVYVQGEKDKPNYIAKIVELFEGEDKEQYFSARWYYRHIDTLIGDRVHEELKDLFDEKRVFYSDITDENPLDCIVSKIKIVQVSPFINSSEIPECTFYCDMSHSLSYSTIAKLPEGFLNRSGKVHELSSATSIASSAISSEASCSDESDKKRIEKCTSPQKDKKCMKLLDLYAGCGGMSTGLCLGAAIADVNLLTRWAVDMNKYACESLRFNHPETEVRNESAEDFLTLLKEWNELCKKYCSENESSETSCVEQDSEVDENGDESEELSDEEFEVENFIDICFGDPNYTNKKGLYLKVQWKGYDSSYDTWEPIDTLSACQERIKEFVVQGRKANILPLPGDADVVCGGPPCQGVSGFNRFRDSESPLRDEKNRQLLVFMDIIGYLKPKYVLMENVTDLLKFVDGYLGRYALGRLVGMKYQTRLGLMAAGSYGLPQLRMRAFFWGACPSEMLPQFPRSTHEAIGRLSSPNKFLENLVNDDKDGSQKLKAALVLQDILTDLPPIKNDEDRDEMPYDLPPQTEFQKQIRLLKDASHKAVLYDHRPLKLNTDDYQRVCRIPKEKGANFRNLPGLMVDENNIVHLDPSVEREELPSGAPLVPDYAISFVDGKSLKPFGRLWWDEIVPTVVTRAEPHNQRILHPLQDRVLSIRENARIQGFPDYYKLFGSVKERYIQVGNAVAVPVGRALGYALGRAMRGERTDEPLLVLPPNFPNCAHGV